MIESIICMGLAAAFLQRARELPKATGAHISARIMATAFAALAILLLLAGR